jgi:peptidoglycan/LPS O-acetylase OafA/YrhL
MFLGFFILLPEDLVHHPKIAGLSSLTFNNFYILNTPGDYFSREVASIPLMHTWSLVVEE